MKNIQRIKYPRTLHLPWSQAVTADDKVLRNTNCFENKEVIITEKMDGENSTLYNDHMHARSVESSYHPSRTWLKSLQAKIAHLIPENWRVCGENVYAKHSLEYTDLESYFLVFSIWDHNNFCLDWQTTIEWVELLGLVTPKVLYQGKWDEKKVRNLSIDTTISEGYVVRSADSFHYDDFNRNCAKWVRASHVQTDTHWSKQEVIPNKLKSGK